MESGSGLYAPKKQQNMKTKTIFRKFKDTGEIIALFPEIPHDVNGFTCSSYMHVGQHGASSLGLHDVSKPATPEEYAPLQRELESIGYDLQIIKRIPRNAYQTRKAQLAS